MSVEGLSGGFCGFRSSCIGSREIGLVWSLGLVRSVLLCVVCFKEKRRLVPFSVPGHGPLPELEVWGTSINNIMEVLRGSGVYYTTWC
jgi:hypothetical protein